MITEKKHINTEMKLESTDKELMNNKKKILVKDQYLI